MGKWKGSIFVSSDGERGMLPCAPASPHVRLRVIEREGMKGGIAARCFNGVAPPRCRTAETAAMTGMERQHWDTQSRSDKLSEDEEGEERRQVARRHHGEDGARDSM